MDFKGQLASALVLNVALKLITFTLSTALTRQLAPDENGVNFSYQLYFNTVLFLSRECVRSVNARRSLRERGDHRAAVVQMMNYAITSLPLGVCVMLCLELLPYGAIHLFPSLASLVRIGHGVREVQSVSPHGMSASVFHSSGSLGAVLPEVVLALSVVLSLVAEPYVALVQSLDHVRLIVTSEFYAILARLGVSLAAVWLYGGIVGNMYAARCCFAAGSLAHALATVLYFTTLWISGELRAIRLAVTRHPKAPSPRLSLRDCLFPLSVLSLRVVWVEACRGLPLAVPFFCESALRFVLTEGERLALRALGTPAAMGHYDLVANLGSLVARLVFRVWEAACFAKWSRDAAGGRPDEAKALLRAMLRLASCFGAAAVLLGPPLAETVLTRLFSSRWAAPAVVRALRLYCHVLPLLGWNGLLDAFVRATATPPVLRLAQRWMIAQAVLYVMACGAVLRLHSTRDAAAALIVVNGVSMSLRCLAAGWLMVRRTPKQTALQWGDLAMVLDRRIAGVWVGLFALTRWWGSLGVVLGLAAPTYIAAVALWDPEVRSVAVGLLRGKRQTEEDERRK